MRDPIDPIVEKQESEIGIYIYITVMHRHLRCQVAFSRERQERVCAK